MKTPKREREDIVPIDEPVYDCMGGICDISSNWEPVHIAHARWKRKNRIAQLKRSLHRYRDCTNLPFYCHELHAYKWLQELKYPGKKATADDWDIHIRFLKTIHCHIWQAIHQAEREQEQAKRKEMEK